MPRSTPCSGRCCCAPLGKELPAAAIGIAYAVTDEVHQAFVPGRQGAVRDVLIDAVGVLIGVYVLGRAVRRVVA